MSLESPSSPPADVPAVSASPPRSKLDFLFQEMLIESGRTADRNAQIAAQLDQVALIARGLPAQLRQASAEAAAEVATTASRSLSEAARSLSKADWDLRVTVGALAGVNLRNAWRIGILCAGSSFMGAVLGTLITQLVLA